MIPTCKIIAGDALEELRQLDPGNVQCCVTSPPYFGLRDYGDSRQLGAEETPGLYISRLVEISREIKRALKDDGTFWLNLGDSYYNYRPGAGQKLVKQTLASNGQDLPQICARRGNVLDGFKEKDRMMIPARCAIALQADGWYLRDEIVWNKPNPMPESVTDRTTKSHEFIYLLTKNPNYFYDQEAIRENARSWGTRDRTNFRMGTDDALLKHHGLSGDSEDGFRNKRSVWTVNTFSVSDAHFATYPPDLIKPCILAGSRPGDTILDPFAGTGTTGQVALELGRNCVLIELNDKYVRMCESRTNITPGFAL